MASNVILPEDINLAKKVIDTEHEINKKKTENGFLGNFWGSPSSAPNNIAALTVVVLVIYGVICSMNSDADCWETINPLITLSLGYLFGGKTKEIS